MGLSERPTCSIVGAERSMIRYRSTRSPDTELRTQLRDLANERKRFGYRRLFIPLRQDGDPSGINRLYREEGLTVQSSPTQWRGPRAPCIPCSGESLKSGVAKCVRPSASSKIDCRSGLDVDQSRNGGLRSALARSGGSKSAGSASADRPIAVNHLDRPGGKLGHRHFARIDNGRTTRRSANLKQLLSSPTQ